MAMSKCPECGKELSNTVEKCIHCGCEVKICPECKQLALSSAESCPVCGFSFTAKEKEPPIEAPKKEEKEEKSTVRISDAYNNWNERKKYETRKKSISLATTFTLLLLTLSVLTQIAAPSSLKWTSIIFVFPAVILMFITSIVPIASRNSMERSFYHYCIDKKLSIKEMLLDESKRNYISMDQTEKASWGIRTLLALNAEFYNDTKKSRGFSIFLSLLRDAILNSFLCIFAIFGPTLIDSLFSPSSPLLFQIIFSIAILLFAGILLMSVIVFPRLITPSRRNKLYWVSQNIPDAYPMIEHIYKKIGLTDF